jgi:hypothetical protein
MEQDKLKELKEAYIENTKKFTINDGGMFSHIAIFGLKIDSNQDGTLFIPVNDEFLSSPVGKETFEKIILPQIVSHIKKDYIVASAVWTSEAWIRTSDKLETLHKDWQEIPIKKEALIMCFKDSDNDASVIIYDINRTGKKVTEDGDMIDTIELELTSTATNGSVDPNGRLFDMLNLFF